MSAVIKMPFRYVVETGVPLPPKKVWAMPGRKRGDANWCYPFVLMKAVGDSFFIPYDDMGPMGGSRLTTAIGIRQRRGEGSFCWRSRTLEEHGEHGWRVWKTG